MATDRETPDEQPQHAEQGEHAEQIPTGLTPAEPSPADAPSSTEDPGTGEAHAEKPSHPEGASPADEPTAPLQDLAEDPSEPEASTQTRLRNQTTARAVLRPVPEGFPTPPPRPARPNRRPALATPPEQRDPGRGRLLVVAAALVGVLALVIAVGGAFLVVRTLSTDGESTAPAATASADTSDGSGQDAGPVEVDGVTVAELRTETGLDSVGSGATEVTAEGQFVAVIVEITNDSERTLQLTADRVTLATAAGENIPSSAAAISAYARDSDSASTRPIPVGETREFVAVFDAPIGSEPAALHLELDGDLTIELPLAG